jgi:hypothetical protein
MTRTLKAEVPGVTLDGDSVPNTFSALDAVEFFARRVSKPVEPRYHSYFGHEDAVKFERAEGLEEYRADVTMLLERCRHPYEVDAGGYIRHISPPVLQEALKAASFHTGDADLDRLLVTAATKFGDKDAAVRLESLEKLWDAWERLKSLLPGDKSQSVKELLDQAIAEPNLRAQIEEEARALTAIGKIFMIRHTETNRTKIDRAEHVDYLFHRMFALVFMILRATGRASL